MNDLICEHPVLPLLGGALVMAILMRLIAKPAPVKKERAPMRPVPPIDKAAAFEKLKQRIHQEDGWPINKVARELVQTEEIFTLSQVKALTNSAFIAGSTMYETDAARTWTYEEWEKENLL